jgi:hypothetical protein
MVAEIVYDLMLASCLTFKTNRSGCVDDFRWAGLTQDPGIGVQVEE